MNRPVLFLLVAAAALGVSLGGAFIGGMLVGKSQADAASAPAGISAFGVGPGSEVSGITGPGQSGGENAGGVGLQFPGQDGSRADALAGRGGLMGTVESVDGNTVTINTPRGPVRAVIGDDTSISRVTEGTLDDLAVGVQVRVVGEDVEGEGLAAASVTIILEGSERPLGQGMSGGQGFQQGRPGQ